jgi:hypothetical protein
VPSIFFSVGIKERPSIPPPVPIEVDVRVDDLWLSAPTSPLVRAPTLVAECPGRREVGGVARTLAGDCFGGREPGALHAPWRQSVLKGESQRLGAHTGSRVFRREGELGASCAFRRRSVSEGESWGYCAHQRR